MDWTQISIKDLVVSIQTKMISKFPCRYWKTSWQLFDIQKMMSHQWVNQCGQPGDRLSWRLKTVFTPIPGATDRNGTDNTLSLYILKMCICVDLTYIYLNVFLFIQGFFMYMNMYVHIFEHDHDIFVRGSLFQYIYLYIYIFLMCIYS